MSVFIDRGRELSLLKERLAGDRAEFVVIYGRRRVGKSELIDQFIKKSGNGIRLLAREESKALQLRNFASKLGDFFHDDFLKKTPFADWDGFFEYLSKRADKRMVVAIDEFPYLVKEDPSLPSVLQDYWEGKLKKSKIFLILSGSSISMMESKVLGHRSPLYGRRTGQLLLRPLKFMDIWRYVNDLEKAVEFYSVFGGTPAYFMEADVGKDVFTNIADKILREDSFVYKDVEFVLRQELVEPRYYFSILLSISRGNHRAGLIVNDTGLSKSVVNKYLSVLKELHLVHRRLPITESYKSRRGLWFLSDNLFDFWFRFAYPYLYEIERGIASEVIKSEVKPFFNQYVGRHFEDVIREILEQGRTVFPFRFTKTAPWWHKDKEIDLVGLNEKTGQILFVECKWKEKVNAEKILNQLMEKSKYVKWRNRKRKEYYAIFAKSFTRKTAGNNVFCFDLRDLKKKFR